jgi:hypothetical protein
MNAVLHEIHSVSYPENIVNLSVVATVDERGSGVLICYFQNKEKLGVRLSHIISTNLCRLSDLELATLAGSDLSPYFYI